MAALHVLDTHCRLRLNRLRRRSLPKTYSNPKSFVNGRERATPVVLGSRFSVLVGSLYPLNGQHDQRGDAEHNRAQPPLAHPIADREAAASDIDRGVE